MRAPYLMSSKANRTPLFIFFAVTLNGCVNLAPPAVRPSLPVTAASGSDGQWTADLSWRAVYTDPRLQQLIALSLENNRDLRVATLSVERARAQYQIQHASGLPAVDLGLNASRSKDGGKQFSASVGFAAYELDFFSRVRNLNASALQDFLRRDESRLSAQISLIAETANAWLTLATDLQRQALAQRTLQNRQQHYALTVVRQRLGATGELPLAQAQTAVLAAKAQLLNYGVQIAQDRNALELIVGCPLPAELLPRMDQDALTTPMSMPPGPAGIASEILLRRPDVQAAEHGLQGAYANIGAVRASRFPRITLMGSTGSAGEELSRLFERGVWNFGTGLALSVFDGGSHRANARAAEVERDIAVAQYDKTIQVAFREASDALAVSDTLVERTQTQQKLLDAARRQLTLAQVQRRTGGSSELELLDAQRALYGAELDMISLRLSIQNNRITLYKVLGGGWNNAALPQG